MGIIDDILNWITNEISNIYKYIDNQINIIEKDIFNYIDNIKKALTTDIKSIQNTINNVIKTEIKIILKDIKTIYSNLKVFEHDFKLVWRHIDLLRQDINKEIQKDYNFLKTLLSEDIKNIDNKLIELNQLINELRKYVDIKYNESIIYFENNFIKMLEKSKEKLLNLIAKSFIELLELIFKYEYK